jgi:hypothetical protein
MVVWFNKTNSKREALERTKRKLSLIAHEEKGCVISGNMVSCLLKNHTLKALN